MKFKVAFRTDEVGTYAATGEQREIGCEDIVRLRREADCDIPLDRIEGTLLSQNFAPEYSLTFEQAQEIPACKNTHSIIVIVPQGWGQDKLITTWDICRDEETGKVITAKMKYNIDRKRLYEEWKDLCFPGNITIT